MLSCDEKLLSHCCVRSVSSSEGASINYVGRRGGGGLSKCLCDYISLCSNFAYEGGGGEVKNWQNLAYVVYGWPLR